MWLNKTPFYINLNLFISCRASGLFPQLDYCAQCCDKRRCQHFSFGSKQHRGEWISTDLSNFIKTINIAGVIVTHRTTHTFFSIMFRTFAKTDHIFVIN
jgi:hypothetical protein